MKRFFLLLTLFFLLGLGETNATSIRVCNKNGDYRTVGQAISAANNNTAVTEIQICPGLYDETQSHTVSRPGLIITGESGKAEDVKLSSQSTIFLLKHTDITIKSISIESRDDNGIQIKNTNTNTNGTDKYNFKNIIIVANDYGIYGEQSTGDYDLSNVKIESKNSVGIYFSNNAGGNYKFESIDVESEGSSIYFAAPVTTSASSFSNMCLSSNDNYGLEFNDRSENILILKSYFKKSIDGGINFSKIIKNVIISESYFTTANKYSIEFQNGTDSNSEVIGNCFFSNNSGSQGNIFSKNYWKNLSWSKDSSISSLKACPIEQPSSCFVSLPPDDPTTPVAPGSFNAFDTNTPAANTTGNIKTKIAGSSFPLTIAALNSNKTGLLKEFSGTVKLDLLGTNLIDHEDNGCPKNATLLATSNLKFEDMDNGAKTSDAFVVSDTVWRNVRVRITFPATGTPEVVACSTDNFAIRPAYLRVSAHDENWEVYGSARLLSDTGPVHKAGKPFLIKVTPYNAKGNVVSNYVKTSGPTEASRQCSWSAGFSHSGEQCATGTLALGTWAENGDSLTTQATYSEAGNLKLALQDKIFAQVDQETDESTRTISQFEQPLTVGRFVPDHFTLDAPNQPAFQTFNDQCAQRSFTYIGQPFGYDLPPGITVSARNAMEGITTNHIGNAWNNLQIAQSYESVPLLISPLVPSVNLTPGAGTAQIELGKNDMFVFRRDDATPQSPFDAKIHLRVEASKTFTGTGQGSTSAIKSQEAYSFGRIAEGIAFDNGHEFRYGQLRLANAHGSDRLDLPVPITVHYWDDIRFVLNTVDHCTAVPASALGFSALQGGFRASNSPRPGLPFADPAFTLQNGRSQIVLKKPSAPLAAAGSASLCINLTDPAGSEPDNCQEGIAAGLPWLKGPPLSPPLAGLRDPESRATFGVFKSGPVIYKRENY